MKIKRILKEAFQDERVIEQLANEKTRTALTYKALEALRNNSVVPKKWKTTNNFGSRRKAVEIKNATNKKLDSIQQRTGKSLSELGEMSSRNPLAGVIVASNPTRKTMRSALDVENVIKKKIPAYKRLTDRTGESYSGSTISRVLQKMDDKN